MFKAECKVESKAHPVPVSILVGSTDHNTVEVWDDVVSVILVVQHYLSQPRGRHPHHLQKSFDQWDGFPPAREEERPDCPQLISLPLSHCSSQPPFHLKNILIILIICLAPGIDFPTLSDSQLDA